MPRLPRTRVASFPLRMHTSCRLRDFQDSRGYLADGAANLRNRRVRGTSWCCTAHAQNRKIKKEQREKDIELFNRKQIKGVQAALSPDDAGIKALQDHGFLGLAAKEVAQFLHTEPRLQRAAVLRCFILL